MSRERLEALHSELNYLKTVREKEVAELIKEARSFGDLSENSEYDEAKTEQGKLYSKMAEIENIISNAIIIEEVNASGSVGMGSRIKVVDLDTNDEEQYQLVGSQEADPLKGRISDDSPFGSALMGKAEGDVVSIEVPDGTLRVKIVEILTQ